MLDRLMGAILSWVVPRIGTFIAGVFSKIKSWWTKVRERKKLTNKQEERLKQAAKVEALRQLLIKIEKGEVKVSNSKKKELIDELRQESRKLTSS